MINASRRSFLGGLLALTAVAASGIPAFADIPTLYGDGIHDDTDALNSLFSGSPVRVEGENIIAKDAKLTGGTFLISGTVTLGDGSSIEGASFKGARPFSPIFSLDRAHSARLSGCSVKMPMSRDAAISHHSEKGRYASSMEWPLAQS